MRQYFGKKTNTIKFNKNGKLTSNGRINRRDFLKTGALSSFALGAGSFLDSCSPNGSKVNGDIKGTARNVIFLVSDGMSMGTLSMADQMMRRRDGKTSNWIRLYEEQRVNRWLMDVASRDSIVTDSAASSAAWGCGKRVNNWSRDGPQSPGVIVCCQPLK